MLPLRGEWTIDTFSQHLETLPLFDHEPEQHAYLDYRRWAFESAALDLALRQAGRSLGDAVGRTAEPLTFVVSTRLGEPATTDRLQRLARLYPSLRFKLDATADWSDELIAELAATGAVDSVDFKGQYHGTSVDTVPDAALYRRIVDRASRRLARGSRADAGDRGSARAAPRARHLGRGDPLGRGHRGAPLAAADGERQAVAVRLGRAAPRARTTTARRTGSAPTAGGSSSSGSVATISSCWRRSSIPETPNDVAPSGFNLDPGAGPARPARSPSRPARPASPQRPA